MNIFVLDEDMEKNARYHVDRHVIKMITEQNQLLCSAIHLKGNPKESPYKLTHANHPCSIWVRSSIQNYKRLIELTKHLCREYTFRYGKKHLGESVLEIIAEAKVDLPNIGLTPFALAMPDKYKIDNAVGSYRNYYLNDKRHLFNWKNREIPEWVKDIV